MYIVAFTLDSDQSDHYFLCEDYGEAKEKYESVLEDSDTMCAGIAPVIEATDPHWVEADKEEAY